MAPHSVVESFGSDSSGLPELVDISKNNNGSGSSLETNKEGIQGGSEPIAIVGIGCRLPGEVKSASHLWDLLMEK